jgi:Cysteine-rich domain
MSSEPLMTNRLREERLAAGFGTPEQLAAAVDIEPEWYAHMEAGHVLPTHQELDRLTDALGGILRSRLFDLGSLNLIPGQRNNEPGYAPNRMFRGLADTCHVLVSRDEITWYDRQPGPDHDVDVFMNLSCGTQAAPHLLLDTVSVLERLGISFVAVAGPAACCGKPFTNADKPETAERVNKSRIGRSLGWGARVHVNWCVACQMTSTVLAARRLYADDVDHPVREVQILTFLEAQLRDLGDRVPWKQEVHRRVLVSGHSEMLGPAHKAAHAAAARLLSLVPGVEVVGPYDGHEDDSPCTYMGRDKDWTPPAWYREQDTAEGIRKHRARLATLAHSMGADTVSCTHQHCHIVWSAYASDRLAVRHPVSIVAEALGCAHPDRRQAAMRLGNPEAFVAQTRRIWQSWGLSEERARELAGSISDPKYADEATQCSGCSNHCRESLISVDVLTGVSQPV